jgi:hypothetical protein
MPRCCPGRGAADPQNCYDVDRIGAPCRTRNCDLRIRRLESRSPARFWFRPFPPLSRCATKENHWRARSWSGSTPRSTRRRRRAASSRAAAVDHAGYRPNCTQALAAIEAVDQAEAAVSGRGDLHAKPVRSRSRYFRLPFGGTGSARTTESVRRFAVGLTMTFMSVACPAEMCIRRPLMSHGCLREAERTAPTVADLVVR